jgi:hypothetical protein
MSIRVRALALLLLLALPLVAGAGIVRSAVHGRLLPAVQTGDERGWFRLVVAERSDGGHVEKVQAYARGLDATQEYHVFLVKSGGTDAADFGAMTMRPSGRAFLNFTTWLTQLPAGVVTISDYAGGTVEVRDGSTAVLTGTIPTFIDLSGQGGNGAAAFGHDSSRLTAVDTSFHGAGSMTAGRQDTASGVREEFLLLVHDMASGTTYTAFAIAAPGSEVQLGTFTTSDPLGLGGFRLATALGDTIPGGGVLGLAGEMVEVRDAGGTAVLRGTLPTIP